MGNNGSESYSPYSEFPQHSVYLSAYYIGKYEVTRGEYRQFIEAGGFSNPDYWSSPGWFWKGSRTEPYNWAEVQTWNGHTFTQTDNHPVVGVNYYEAEAFCKWAGGRLPTEAEWEKAARWTGEYPNEYPWGNTWNAEMCNCWDDTNPVGGGYKSGQTTPVGSYPNDVSPYGCYDMAGNVSEWCKDICDYTYYYVSPPRDPQGPKFDGPRILRGGNWNSNEFYNRCAYRYGLGPHTRSTSNGFRLVRSLFPTPPTLVSAKANADGSAVDLEWTAPDYGTVSHYKIERSDGDDQSFYAIENNCAGLSYSDTSGECDIKYRYRVIAVECNGNESTPSNVKASIKCYSQPPEFPCEMVRIPAGSFLMGSSYFEGYSNPNEQPQHLVYLTDYCIGKYEVTRGEYRQFMEAGGYSNPDYWSSEGWQWKVSANRAMPYHWAEQQNWGSGAFIQTDDHPVVGVTYYEAEAFCNWAGGHLPTEAQWEKAARWTGTHPNKYPWGTEWDVEKCNNQYDTNPAGGGPDKSQTAPVGSYPSGVSPYGCYDMAGNVREWCKDRYREYSADPSNDPQGPASGTLRVVRDGSWSHGNGYDDYYRCAFRDYEYPDTSRSNTIGFRLAAVPKTLLPTVSAAKALSDDTSVTLNGKIVTYTAADFFYVEEDNRTMGIRVEKSDHGLEIGFRTDVTGVMKTNAHKERYILASGATQSPVTGYAGNIDPLGMNNLAIGGGDWRVSGTAGQSGVTGGVGVNNIGLLVKVWGKFDKIDDTTFQIDDGSGRHIRCKVNAGTTLDERWEYVTVEGISSIYKDDDSLYIPLVLVREIQVASPQPLLIDVEMIHVPAGSFLMGNNGNEPFSNSDELPQHLVYLSDYHIGKYEVTRGEYRQFMEAGGYSNPAYWSSEGWQWKLSESRTEPLYWMATQTWRPGQTFTQTDNYPVIGVTYYEAEAFCNWVGGRLPTEAEWEKAARWTGSSPNIYPWGNVWDVEKCNNVNDTNSAGGGYKWYQTAPVGSYPAGASPYGCHDMAGNVWEWCKDWYSSSYYSVSPSSDPQGPKNGALRVGRGGSWFTFDDDTRCSRRLGYFVDRGSTVFGFRLAY